MSKLEFKLINEAKTYFLKEKRPLIEELGYHLYAVVTYVEKDPAITATVQHPVGLGKLFEKDREQIKNLLQKTYEHQGSVYIVDIRFTGPMSLQ